MILYLVGKCWPFVFSEIQLPQIRLSHLDILILVALKWRLFENIWGHQWS